MERISNEDAPSLRSMRWLVCETVLVQHYEGGKCRSIKEKRIAIVGEDVSVCIQFVWVILAQDSELGSRGRG